MVKDIIHYGLVLMLVTVIASASLTMVNNATYPKIQAQKARELEAGLMKVLPGSDIGVIVPVLQDDVIQYYYGYSGKDTTRFIGIAYSAFGKGYSSTIWTLVGCDTSGNILKIQVLDQKETPGLGTKCMEIKSGDSTPWFQRQFIDKQASRVSVDKDGGDIVSITGATITSRAITQSISDQANKLELK